MQNFGGKKQSIMVCLKVTYNKNVEIRLALKERLTQLGNGLFCQRDSFAILFIRQSRTNHFKSPSINFDLPVLLARFLNKNITPSKLSKHK